MPKFSLMKIIFFLTISINFLFAQSTFIPLNSDIYHTIDRLELIEGKIIPTVFTGIKPFSRKAVIEYIENNDSLRVKKGISKADLNNIQNLKNNSWEWLKNEKDSSIFSKKKLFNLFLERKSDFYSLKNEVIDLHISPIFQFSGGKDGDLSIWQNTRGIEIRGTISKKLGFYTMFTENQVVLPNYIMDFHKKNQVIPGEGHWKPYKLNGIDYLSGIGYFTFNPLKPISLTFGQDRNFIGNGIRSVLLSDFSAPYLFLKINTQIGKVQYQNLFTQLTDRQNYTGNSLTIPKKYMVTHHLSINVGKKLNIGLMEAVVLSRPNHIELNYLNPIIFLRFVESFEGSPDNAMAGINFKYLTNKKVSFFGQFMLDEFILKKILHDKGYYTNKYAFQIGAKAVNLFGIKNLDIQTEVNAARPYTYSHLNTTTNFAHYNQALAHPLGANFAESATVLRYQFNNKMLFVGTFVHANYGLDRINQNWGGDILKNYETRVRDENNYVGQGINTSLNFVELRLSKQIIQNMFIDASVILRSATNSKENKNSTIPNVGIRWNMPYKQTAF